MQQQQQKKVMQLPENACIFRNTDSCCMLMHVAILQVYLIINFKRK